MYMDGLPKEYKIPQITHNRNSLSLRNRSRLFYQVAGLRAKGTLGRGKAITFLHGTETSSWGDEEGLASLLASLAETNPDRLYMFESTARGFNMFHDMYVTAKKARTQRAIFCGWWRNEFYSVDPESSVYKTYWDGRLTGEEKNGTATSRSSTALRSTHGRSLGGGGSCMKGSKTTRSCIRNSRPRKTMLS